LRWSAAGGRTALRLAVSSASASGRLIGSDLRGQRLSPGSAEDYCANRFERRGPRVDMPSWIAETPWPVIVACSAVAALLFVGWYARSQSSLLIGAAVCLLIGGATYVVERQIVTDSERVETALNDLLDALKAKDEAAALQHVSASAPSVQRFVEEAIRRVDVLDAVQLSQVDVSMKSQNSRAVAQFRANGPVRWVATGQIHHGVTRWECVWQREGNEWQIIRVTRIDPLTGEELDKFDRG
jgi:hypothetical protein